MMLINALVNSPAQLPTRVSLRADFITLGLLEAVQNLQDEVEEDEEIALQIDILEEEMQATMVHYPMCAPDDHVCAK